MSTCLGTLNWMYLEIWIKKNKFILHELIKKENNRSDKIRIAKSLVEQSESFVVRILRIFDHDIIACNLIQYFLVVTIIIITTTFSHQNVVEFVTDGNCNFRRWLESLAMCKESLVIYVFGAFLLIFSWCQYLEKKTYAQSLMMCKVYFINEKSTNLCVSTPNRTLNFKNIKVWSL